MKDIKELLCEKCKKEARITSYLEGTHHFCWDCHHIYLKELERKYNLGGKDERR